MCNDIEVEAAVIVKLEEINVDLLVDLGIVEINVWSVIVKAFGELTDMEDDNCKNVTELIIGIEVENVVIVKPKDLMVDLFVDRITVELNIW